MYYGLGVNPPKLKPWEIGRVCQNLQVTYLQDTVLQVHLLSLSPNPLSILRIITPSELHTHFLFLSWLVVLTKEAARAHRDLGRNP